MAQPQLSPEQAYALLDILSHHATYREIELFKDPATIDRYGPPFQDHITPSTPILQGLVSKFATTLPSMRDVKPDFWKVGVRGLISGLASADLSESYDKGNLGIRKTLATAISSLIEYPARGLLGSFKRDPEALKDREYDLKNPDDILIAWDHFLQRLVYSDYFNVLYQRASQTQQLADHDTLTQGAHEYILVNIASLMHYMLILSPEGPELVYMIDSVNKLLPYMLIRQTLRVGNVATMISGMLRLLLAKVSTATVTNWIGWTQNADEGMNLLQQTMSTVLSWDKRVFKKRLERVDRDKNGPSQEVKDELRQWITRSREEHLQTREASRQSKMSIVQTILSLSSKSAEMTEPQHKLALQFLSSSLAIRDRNQITRVLCKSNPDHLTQAIRDGVAAYEPMIRQIHQSVNLSETMSDLEAFINDMLALAKFDKANPDTEPPAVEDFVVLLHKHQDASHKFIHQVTKNSEVSTWFRDWCRDVTKHFKRDDQNECAADKVATFLTDLPEEQQGKLRAQIDAHAAYLAELHEASASRIKDVVRNDRSTPADPGPQNGMQQPRPSKAKRTPSSTSVRSLGPSRPKQKTMYGPGSYLAKWQGLLNVTEITPATPFGEVRHGADVGVREAGDGEVGSVGGLDEAEKKRIQSAAPRPPDVRLVVDVLGPRFSELLVQQS